MLALGFMKLGAILGTVIGFAVGVRVNIYRTYRGAHR